jgi:hypothetical protein
MSCLEVLGVLFLELAGFVVNGVRSVASVVKRVKEDNPFAFGLEELRIELVIEENLHKLFVLRGVPEPSGTSEQDSKMSGYPDPQRKKLPRDILPARFGRKKADLIGATLHGIDELIVVVTQRPRVGCKTRIKD